MNRLIGTILGAICAFLLFPASASAQIGIYPCNGDSATDIMIGMDARPGQAPQPLCKARPQAGQSPSATAGPSVYQPYHHPAPKGWKQVYGAIATFNIDQRGVDGDLLYGYELTLGHASEAEARALVEQRCKLRAISGCSLMILRQPYVTVVYYPDEPYFGSQRGTYVAWSNSQHYTQGFVERTPGDWEFCGETVRPQGQCAKIVAYVVNGVIPEDKKKRARK
ncbi:MAG: hypothetical protein IE933_04245 [Sphingomonadales bacterium]|nr:hypothetical protein [Sphingomonadales bacterium]MBD3772839.1 hypothetical protein [Paracoccaceae bacterium]